MHPRSLRVLLVASGCLMCGCAYVGEPLPPSLNIPSRIIDLAAVERGDKNIVTFTTPSETTDGVTLRRLREIDLRAGPAGPNWESSSRPIEVRVLEPGPVRIEVPVKEWVGQDIELRVRAASRRGRFSEWSNAVRMKVVSPLDRPILKVEAVSEGVHLVWPAPKGVPAAYRIYRQAPGEQKPVPLDIVKTSEYIDTRAQYGQSYSYSVEAFLDTGGAQAESELSEPVSLTPEDHFAPAVPVGLTAIAGISSVELSWNPDSEPDLRGYFVFRSSGEASFEKLGSIVLTPAYSDHAVESGKRYRYAVSAVDQKGNESARSAPVEVSAP